jgi:Kef-type K+ transport system membrane component KefB
LLTGSSYLAHLGCPNELGRSLSAYRSVACARFAGHLAGLSVPIGAFLAGMVVGESDFRHQVEDDIRPFRDVLLGLFFVTVGMEVDLSTAATAPVAVLAWMIACLPGRPSS